MGQGLPALPDTHQLRIYRKKKLTPIFLMLLLFWFMLKEQINILAKIPTYRTKMPKKKCPLQAVYKEKVLSCHGRREGAPPPQEPGGRGGCG